MLVRKAVRVSSACFYITYVFISTFLRFLSLTKIRIPTGRFFIYRFFQREVENPQCTVRFAILCILLTQRRRKLREFCGWSLDCCLGTFTGPRRRELQVLYVFLFFSFASSSRWLTSPSLMLQALQRSSRQTHLALDHPPHCHGLPFPRAKPTTIGAAHEYVDKTG